MKTRVLSLVGFVAFAAACIPPKIEIVTAPVAPPPIVAPAPVATPAPKEDPAPVVVLEIPRDQSLEMFILDPAARPIVSATATIDGETRKVSDGEGRIHFDVSGASLVAIAAPGYKSETRDLPPGSHRVHLVPNAVPPVAGPSPAPAPPVDTPVASLPAPVVFTECGPREAPTVGRLGCVRQVAAASANWKKCAAGHDEVACHRFAREVAAALAAGDRRWGLITKQRGEKACSFDRCGYDIDGGYGEDMVAYLPDGAAPNRWLGADLVACLGCPTPTDPNLPSFHWPATIDPSGNRPANLWAPVPK